MDRNIHTPVTFTTMGRTVTIGIEGLDSVEDALGGLRYRMPQALKVAVNKTAREARKMMLAAAMARYAVNAAGERHLKELRQTKKASNRDISATLFISSMRNDLGYFQTRPTQVFSGAEPFARRGKYYKGHVLRESAMEELPGVSGKYSPAFLAKFRNGHIGMVERVLGSSSSHTVTASGKPRFRNAEGNVEKLQTVGSPSATAMHGKIWPEVQDDVREYMMAAIQDRVEWMIGHYGGRK